MGLLIKLKNGDTTLKSLKYGNDRPNGGDSGQPYVKSPIDQPNSIPSEDVILRGGLKAPSSALEDVSRLTKYFFDFKNPDGLLFVAKQNALSKISPKTETSFGLGYGGFTQNINLTTGATSVDQSNGFFNEGVYTPLSTLAQAGVGYLGTHLNKQGLDPTGNSPTLSINKYQDVAYKNNLPENNAYSGEVPLSLVTKSQRASDKAGRKLLARNKQLEKTANTVSSNPERTEVFTRAITPLSNLSNVTFAGINLGGLGAAGAKGALALEQQRAAFFERWDRYVDNVSQRKFNRKDNASEKAFARQTNLYNQVLEEESKVRYDNRLLNLWNANYLNRDNPIDGPDPNPVLYSYGGGPSSVLGIGSTNIKFATKNDGLTPLRTTDGLFYPQKDYTRQVTYSTINIFGGTGYGENENNSVSFKYFLQSSNDFTSPEEIFGNFRPDVNDNTPDPDLGLSHSKYLDIFNSNNYKVINSNIYNNSTRPLVKYDVSNIYGFYGDNSVSFKWLNLYPDSNLFNGLSKSEFIQNNQDNPDIILPTNNIGPTYNASGELTNQQIKTTSGYKTWNQSQFVDIPLQNIGDTSTKSDFRQVLLKNDDYYKSFLSKSPEYTIRNMENRIGLGRLNDPGKKGDVSNYVEGKKGPKGSQNEGKVLGPVDIINALPIYKSSTPSVEDELRNDLVKFRIGIIDNDSPTQKYYMHFRAFIDDFSDSYSAKWDGQKYMGRGEQFYKYGGFDRDIDISFTVVALSKQELIPMYKKLNYLVSSLAPKYSSGGYMGGNMADITLGSWIVGQPGIITSISLTVPDDSPWEIAIPIENFTTQTQGQPIEDPDEVAEKFSDNTARELPHMVKVKLKFIPIHKFRPEINKISGMDPSQLGNTPDGLKDKNSYGKQKYIKY